MEPQIWEYNGRNYRFRGKASHGGGGTGTPREQDCTRVHERERERESARTRTRANAGWYIVEMYRGIVIAILFAHDDKHNDGAAACAEQHNDEQYDEDLDG